DDVEVGGLRCVRCVRGGAHRFLPAGGQARTAKELLGKPIVRTALPVSLALARARRETARESSATATGTAGRTPGGHSGELPEDPGRRRTAPLPKERRRWLRSVVTQRIT